MLFTLAVGLEYVLLCHSDTMGHMMWVAHFDWPGGPEAHNVENIFTAWFTILGYVAQDVANLFSDMLLVSSFLTHAIHA
jgi:hypothetical protein